MATEKSTIKNEAKPKAAPRVRKAKKAEGEIPHLRIRVRAYEHKILDASLKQIMDTAARYDAEIHGPVPIANGDKEVYSQSRLIHRQEFTGAVRDEGPQALDRYHQPESESDRSPYQLEFAVRSEYRCEDDVIEIRIYELCECYKCRSQSDL